MVLNDTVFLLTLLSIIVSPLGFFIAKNTKWLIIHGIIVILFFVSWYWALYYMLTPEKLYFPEILFIAMIFLALGMVWITLGNLLIYITKWKATSVIVITILLGVLSFTLIFFYKHEIYETNFEFFYAQFHLLYCCFLLVVIVIGSLLRMIKIIFQRLK
jgi:hypothetical protein